MITGDPIRPSQKDLCTVSNITSNEYVRLQHTHRKLWGKFTLSYWYMCTGKVPPKLRRCFCEIPSRHYKRHVIHMFKDRRIRKMNKHASLGVGPITWHLPTISIRHYPISEVQVGLRLRWYSNTGNITSINFAMLGIMYGCKLAWFHHWPTIQWDKRFVVRFHGTDMHFELNPEEKKLTVNSLYRDLSFLT
jgi:hypothetical protein